MRSRSFALAAAAAAALAACAAADAPSSASAELPDLSGQVLAVGCRQGQCVWMRPVALDRAGTAADGELRRLVARRGLSAHDPLGDPPEAWSPSLAVEWETEDASFYAFCSTARPAYAFPDDEGEGLVLHRLDLFDLAGYQTSSAGMYLRLCHGLALDEVTDAELAALGYGPGARSGQEQVAGPEALLRP